MISLNFRTSHSLLANLLHIILFSPLIIQLATGLSFNFTSFSASDVNISLEGKAFINNQIIQLTYDRTASFGRATYKEFLHLWDKASGNLTGFTTYFSFVIDSQGKSAYGDGLTFFLAPQNSTLPPNITRGSTLGLTRDWQQENTTDNHFVAVEFDIFSNAIDPPGEHVGIDINSTVSVNNISWTCDIKRGIRNEAWITYNSVTHNLSVAFKTDATVMQYLSQTIDLRNYLPEWVRFGFSGATGNNSAVHSVHSWDFSTGGDKEEVATNIPTIPDPNRNTKNRTTLAVVLGAGGALIGGLVLVLVFAVYRRKIMMVKHDRDQVLDEEFRRGTGPKKFLYHQLARATNNFNDEELLGKGGFGGVYKGFLRDMDLNVAVKRISSGSRQGINEYAAEVKIISRLRHRNLVQLIGWCHEKGDLLLVYEFLPNGSLDSHLFKEKSLLTWEVRYKIARGLASGLLYLHEECEKCVVHRDIKSSNVMLDLEFNAKLGDFGLARFVDHVKGSQTTTLAGTMGYLAPECAWTGKASRESDVYSFGVVALEIACGRKPINAAAKESEVSLVEWVWELYGAGELLKAVDPRLGGDFDEEKMERLIIVGLWCAHPDENLRPSIRQAIHVLDFEAPFPVLPPKMPVPTYFTPLVDPASLSTSHGSVAGFKSGHTAPCSSHRDNNNPSDCIATSAAPSPTTSLLYTK